jgi:hypothetical protein
MTRIGLLLALALVAALNSGCFLRRTPKPPKESTSIASEVEATFRQRWVDQRIGQLKAQGVAADAARAQAEAEFREKYEYLQGKAK